MTPPGRVNSLNDGNLNNAEETSEVFNNCFVISILQETSEVFVPFLTTVHQE